MRIYLQNLDYEIWEIFNDCPFVPITKNEKGKISPNHQVNGVRHKKKKVVSKLQGYECFVCPLDKKEFHRVSSCESAQEIWNKLEVVYD